ncbi:hypothetical protein [Clostridium sp. 'White wine YQ']|uniref:hypothetical protein n=1 Tax=Clostridium sp. 'White wine YQ' TaxID=3027474 RepID=UPI002365C4D4|nr:hypothetical protein [Clostridium sp. 'White wine YQ']MDD7794510.1 hypothetical protein [Clostridium sp. 'White wine YQ']
MGKKKDSRYKPGVGYMRGTIDDLTEESKKFFHDVKDNYSGSKAKKSFNGFTNSFLRGFGLGAPRGCGRKRFGSIKIGIYIGLFLFLVFCGLRLSAIILVMLLILALEIC